MTLRHPGKALVALLVALAVGAAIYMVFRDLFNNPSLMLSDEVQLSVSVGSAVVEALAVGLLIYFRNHDSVA